MLRLLTFLLLLTPAAHSHLRHHWEDGSTPPQPLPLNPYGHPSRFSINQLDCIATDAVDAHPVNLGVAGQTVCRLALKNPLSPTCSVGINNTYFCVGDVALSSCVIKENFQAECN